MSQCSYPVIASPSNMLEVQQWMLAINRSAATYSCPPLAAAVGSGSTNKFIRPMFPMRPATTTMVCVGVGVGVG